MIKFHLNKLYRYILFNKIKSSSEVKDTFITAITLTPETEEYLAVSLSNNTIFKTKMP